MADGLAEEGAFSTNLTHFWHFSTLMKRLFIPYSEEKSKRFIDIRRIPLLVARKGMGSGLPFPFLPHRI
jgi:hypothetical protein